MMQGKVAAKTIAAAISGVKIEGEAPKFEGTEFPSYFRRKDGSTSVEIELPQNGEARASFLTDVKNNYLTRAKGKGKVEVAGDLEPTFRLFNGRLTFTFRAGKWKKAAGTVYDTTITISDSSHGPWKLNIKVTIAPPREKEEHESPEPRPPKTDAAPSRPNIIEVKHGPEGAPITVDKEPGSERLQLAVNIESRMLTEAKASRDPTEAAAVEFVFKYGLALIAMGLLDAAKKTPEWEKDQIGCRERIGKVASGVAKVIVPLCLTLPQKLPKKLSKAA
jgi:hypothetical protein